MMMPFICSFRNKNDVSEFSHKCVRCGNTMTAIIRASMQAGLHDRVKHACATAAVQHRTPAPAKSHVPTALLSFFSHAPDPAVGAHARRPQRLCSQVPAPPQSLQVCLLRLCSQMLVPPLSLHLLLWRLCSQMPAPSLAFSGFSGGYARRCWCPRSPCIGSCGAYACTCRCPRSPCTCS
jgi:hypothetical protein